MRPQQALAKRNLLAVQGAACRSHRHATRIFTPENELGEDRAIWSATEMDLGQLGVVPRIINDPVHLEAHLGRPVERQHMSRDGVTISAGSSDRSDALGNLRRCSRSRFPISRSARSALGLGERLEASELLPDHQGVDLFGPLVGDHGLEVRHVAHDRVLERDAVRAEDAA
jgi:hypothetical protein